MRSLFIILLLSLFLNSCNKCKDGHTQVGDATYDTYFFFFDEGSYWVLEEENMNQIDTFKIQYVSLTQVEDEGKPCYRVPHYSVKIKKAWNITKDIFLSRDFSSPVVGFSYSNDYSQIDVINPNILSKYTVKDKEYFDVLVLKFDNADIYWAKGIGPIQIYYPIQELRYNLVDYLVKKNEL